MKAHYFLSLRKTFKNCESGRISAATIIQQLDDLFAATLLDFSYASFELYELYRRRAVSIGGESIDKNVPSFLRHEFLETAFAKDPSDYGVALALGVKHLRLGNPSRAKQLIQRVAKSGYNERAQAQHLLRKHFSDVPTP